MQKCELNENYIYYLLKCRQFSKSMFNLTSGMHVVAY